MACYIVTFDAIGLGADNAIKEHLKSYGYFCPITQSSWAIVSSLSAAQVRDQLSQASPTSRIFVVRSGVEAAWINSFGEKNSEWLKKFL
jgi:hypothetical protein